MPCRRAPVSGLSDGAEEGTLRKAHWRLTACRKRLSRRGCPRNCQRRARLSEATGPAILNREPGRPRRAPSTETTQESERRPKAAEPGDLPARIVACDGIGRGVPVPG